MKKGADKTTPTASEAIVTADGRVMRLISNYEAFVGDSFDRNELPIPGKPINDAQYPEFPPITAPLSAAKSAAKSATKNFRLPNLDVKGQRIRVYLISALVLTIFTWTVLSLFTSSPSSNDISEQISANSGTNTATNKAQMLRDLMDLIIRDNNWTSQRISTLTAYWNDLDDAAKRQLSETPWYQLFVFHLEKQIDSMQQDWASSKENGNAAQILKLAAIIGDKGAGGNNGVASRYQQLVQELARDIADAEYAAANNPANSEDDKNPESEQALNERLKKQLSVYYPSSVNEELAKDESAKPAHSPLITQQNLSSLLDRYKEAYELGDLQKMLALFDTSLLDKTRISNLKNKFLPVFNNTSKRSIYFHNIHWKADNEQVILDSGYNAVLELNSNKGTQNVAAQAEIKINVVNNALRIVSIQLHKRKTNVISNRSAAASSDKAPGGASADASPVVMPTPAQLQDLTTQLVSAYENGDIDRFTSLFSSDVKTNNQVDRKGLKKDYQELFSTTNDRQMFIQNLKWTHEKTGAKGTGDLEVLILSDSGGTVYSMHGKIQLVAQRVDGHVRITHMYHIERKN